MTDKTYFNTKTRGLAFLNGVSEQQGQGKTSCKVKLSVMIGADDKMGYEPMRLWVRGEVAQGVIAQLKPYLNDTNKVTVTFVAADCRAKAFVPQSGNNAGQAVAYQEGSLVFISSARVNGEEVYRAPERDSEE